MNAEKLKRLQAQVRIGGKGTPRRKKKVTHQTAATDDKKLQSSLKKLSVSTIPGIEEVNIIKDDLTVIHFNNPKAQASLSANTFAVTGHGETKKVVEMLPEILPQLGQETVVQLRMFANSITTGHNQKQKQADAAPDDFVDDVPLLVENFDHIAKQEASSESKLKSSAKPKNKSKGSTEDKLNNVEEPKSDQKQQVSDINAPNIEESNQFSVETENKASFDGMKPQAVDLKQSESQTQQNTEKEGQQKMSVMDKSEEIKENLQKESAQSTLNNKAQTKNKNKKDTTAQSDSKDTQKQESKKYLPCMTTTKGASKDNIQKDSQQSEKKTQQVRTNKNTQAGISHKEEQQHKKNQTIKKQSVANNQVPSKDIEPKEEVVENVASKDDLTTKTPSQGHKQSSEEKHSVPDLKISNKDMIKLNNNIANQQQKAGETSSSEEIKPKSVEGKTIISDLALPIPPIIPRLNSPILTTQETDHKLNTAIPLGFKTTLDSITSEALKEASATAITFKDNHLTSAQKNNASVIPAHNVAIVLESTQSEKRKETGHLTPNNEPVKLEEQNPKIEPSEALILPEIVAESLGTAPKPKGEPIPSQQKPQGETKQQSNQNQNAQKETIVQPSNQMQFATKETTKHPATQHQKQALDLKKVPADTGNKKSEETPKRKQAPTKPQPTNNNNTSKPQLPQQLQQQPTQKTSAAGQTPCKTNEKPAATSKPANSKKAVPTSTATAPKKPGTTSNPTPTNSRTSNSAANSKNKPNTTANKPKAQTPQKQEKPRSNTAMGAPNPKAVEKQTTPPTPDVKAATPPQTIAKQ